MKDLKRPGCCCYCCVKLCVSWPGFGSEVVSRLWRPDQSDSPGVGAGLQTGPTAADALLRWGARTNSFPIYVYFGSLAVSTSNQLFCFPQTRVLLLSVSLLWLCWSLGHYYFFFLHVYIPVSRAYSFIVCPWELISRYSSPFSQPWRLVYPNASFCTLSCDMLKLMRKLVTKNVFSVFSLFFTSSSSSCRSPGCVWRRQQLRSRPVRWKSVWKSTCWKSNRRPVKR